MSDQLILMEGKFPLKVDLSWSKEGAAYVVQDKSGKSTKMDAISFLVWVQCDGKTSVGSITDVFAVGGNKDIIKTAIASVLQKLTESGMVSWV